MFYDVTSFPLRFITISTNSCLAAKSTTEEKVLTYILYSKSIVPYKNIEVGCQAFKSRGVRMEQFEKFWSVNMAERVSAVDKNRSASFHTKLSGLSD